MSHHPLPPAGTTLPEAACEPQRILQAVGFLCGFLRDKDIDRPNPILGPVRFLHQKLTDLERCQMSMTIPSRYDGFEVPGYIKLPKKCATSIPLDE